MVRSGRRGSARPTLVNGREKWTPELSIVRTDPFTPGDSGKTAVVNALGMERLQVVYCGLAFFPGSRTGRIFRQYEALFAR